MMAAAVVDLYQPPMSYEHHYPQHVMPNNNELATELCSFEQTPSFDISDYLMLDQVQVEVEEEEEEVFVGLLPSENQLEASSVDQYGTGCNHQHGRKRMRIEPGRRIGFRTKSIIEVLDDGYKWRKYGKKSVKNSPNPRNYYKCSAEGCKVKKRVERDREDPSYVLTTYEGTHDHACPTGPSHYGYNYLPIGNGSVSSWS